MSSKVLRIPHPDGVSPARASLDLEGAEEFYVGKTVLEGGFAGYEPEVFAALNALVETTEGPVRFLDIGANVGLFSLVLAAVHGDGVRVSCFEPMPALADFVRKAARRNGLAVELATCALAAEDGVATFYLSSQSDASNSLNRRFRPHRDTMEVEVKRLDTLYADMDGPLVIKLDTESTEPDVLEGGKALIERCRPPIVCEVLAGRTEDRLAKFFAEHAYASIHLTDAPDWAGADAPVGDSTYTYRDWLFLPGPADPALVRAFARWYGAFAPQR